MSNVCEPANYRSVALTITRSKPGSYQLYVHHSHEGARSYCPNNELYDDLDWQETLHLLDVCADGRRPGMHPAGWEQMDLWGYGEDL